MTTQHRIFIDAVIEDAPLSLEALCRAGAVTPQWVVERVASGLLAGRPGEPQAWRFDAVTLRRVCVMARLERDFEAAPELAALVADLQDEIDSLRRRLQRVGL